MKSMGQPHKNHTNSIIIVEKLLIFKAPCSYEGQRFKNFSGQGGQRENAEYPDAPVSWLLHAYHRICLKKKISPRLRYGP